MYVARHGIHTSCTLLLRERHVFWRCCWCSHIVPCSFSQSGPTGNALTVHSLPLLLRIRLFNNSGGLHCSRNNFTTMDEFLCFIFSYPTPSQSALLPSKTINLPWRGVLKCSAELHPQPAASRVLLCFECENFAPLIMGL